MNYKFRKHVVFLNEFEKGKKNISKKIKIDLFNDLLCAKEYRK